MEAYTGFAPVYDMYMDNIPYDDWADNIIKIFQKYDMPMEIVCDLGCGTGQMTRRLKAKGYDMIGIDISYDMLMEAMEAEDSDGILYLCQDMRSFELYGTVGAVVSVCDSINYLKDIDELLTVCKLANNYLDPKGLFVFDAVPDDLAHEGDYIRISSPQTPIRFTKLPDQIQHLLRGHIVSVDVAKEKYIRIEHAYG